MYCTLLEIEETPLRLVSHLIYATIISVLVKCFDIEWPLATGLDCKCIYFIEVFCEHSPAYFNQSFKKKV